MVNGTKKVERGGVHSTRKVEKHCPNKYKFVIRTQCMNYLYILHGEPFAYSSFIPPVITVYSATEVLVNSRNRMISAL